MPSRQNADRDAQIARRTGSYNTPLDKAMGPSGEGARLQELVTPSGQRICIILGMDACGSLPEGPYPQQHA